MSAPARAAALALVLICFQIGVQAQSGTDWIARAGEAYDEGRFEESARAYEQAFEAGEGTPSDHYNAACSWALAGHPDRAFAQLEYAVGGGFRNLELLRGDSDLDSLRADPRWDPILALCQENLEEYFAGVNREMYEIYQADQADRRGDIDWSVVGPRDDERMERTQQLLDAGLLHAPDDFIHAAFIFQHGADSTAYRTANELAMRAVELDSTSMRARWIAAASMDRYLLSIGRKQIYGTQYTMIDGEWQSSPMDSSAVSDEERVRWGVPPLRRE